MNKNDAERVAEEMGREYCRQVAADANHQDGPGEYAEGEDLPEGDYRELAERFGDDNPGTWKEIEDAYRGGYNSEAEGLTEAEAEDVCREDPSLIHLN